MQYGLFVAFIGLAQSALNDLPLDYSIEADERTQENTEQALASVRVSQCEALLLRWADEQITTSVELVASGGVRYGKTWTFEFSINHYILEKGFRVPKRTPKTKNFFAFFIFFAPIF